MPSGIRFNSMKLALLPVILAMTGVIGIFSLFTGETQLVLASGAGAADGTTPAVLTLTDTASSSLPPLEMAVAERIHPSLWKQISQADPAEKIPVIIEWRSASFESVVAAASIEGRSLPEAEQRAAVIAALQENARINSGALQSVLTQAQALGTAEKIHAFWSSPVIAVRAESALIAALSQRPDVTQVRPDERFLLDTDPIVLAETNAAVTVVQGNLELVQAPLAWDALGLDGTGVVVANLDTGVDWLHPALMKHYRGYNPNGPSSHVGNWFVATDEPYIYPGDGYGHGTHTMGTMVGDDGMGNRTGVAPGAKWIAVKVFDNFGVTYESWIHAAFEWVLAPDGDPGLAPDVVNCSWGSPVGSDSRFRPDVTSLRLAGILPVFSAGNNGPYAGSVGSPGSYPESFAVGAVDELKEPAGFSSRGPSPWSEKKPELSAPGVLVRSTFPGGGYALSSGTSMAAPHVAGVVALLLQADPTLSPDGLETILKSSAEPLGAVVPNNETGWGLLNAYAAALQVTHSGEVKGSVRTTGGDAIPYAAVTARTHPEIIPSRTVTIGVSSEGGYLLALQPGRYEITARAFGFYPETLASLVVLTETQYTVNFILDSLPAGTVIGHVSDLDSGEPLPATLSVSGTPIQAQTDPTDGSFSLSLPAGEWHISVETDPLIPHRIGHITPTLSAGQVLPYEIALPAAPAILLVDSGQWYYDSQVTYYETALQMLDYSHRIWPIRNLGLAGEPDDRPTLADLAPYDIVIWSDPYGSPGYIGASDVISDFLGYGGSLLLSGQSIAEIDGGGNPFEYSWYMYRLLSLNYVNEGDLTPLEGVPGSMLEGIQAELNAPDSARQQTSVDTARIIDPTRANPILTWDDGRIGGVVAGVCTPYRAAWLGFGLEGAGPSASRTQIIDRLIGWFQSAPEIYGFRAAYDPSTRIGEAGEVFTQVITLASTGVQTDVLTLSLSGGSWPVQVMLPDGTVFDTQADITLPACEQESITITISIPSGEPFQSFSQHVLSIYSQNQPSAAKQITLTYKTPAPVLLVEAQRWYDTVQPFKDALEANHIPYDFLGGAVPFQMYLYPDLLERYPMVVWAAGYNWFDPLNTYSQASMASYLQNGGRLLVSGQDILDTAGSAPFTQEYLGVEGFTLSITSTEVQPVYNGLLGEDIALQSLAYPYKNWSDGVQPGSQAEVATLDGRLYPNGIYRSGDNWRTIFFSFPLETLGPEALDSVLRRSLAWLSPLGGSLLQAPDAAAAGGNLPVTLTLRLDQAFPPSDLHLTLPIPTETSLQPGSLQGGWEYQAVSHSLVWQGTLSHEQPLVFSALLTVSGSLPAGSLLPLQASLISAVGLPVNLDRTVSIGTPWLEVQAETSTRFPQPGEVFTVSLSIGNSGVISAASTISLTTPGVAPSLMRLQAITGTEWITASGEVWVLNLPPGATHTYTFRAQVIASIDRLPLRFDVSDGYLRQMTGVVFDVYYRQFLPLSFR